jgi:hypothetical protein
MRDRSYHCRCIYVILATCMYNTRVTNFPTLYPTHSHIDLQAYIVVPIVKFDICCDFWTRTSKGGVHNNHCESPLF